MSTDNSAKKLGRPEVDSEAVNVRMQRDLLDQIDNLRRRHPKIPSRPLIARRLIRLGLGAEPILLDMLKMMESLTDDDGDLAPHIAKIRALLEADPLP